MKLFSLNISILPCTKQSSVLNNLEFFFENIVGREIACYKQFLLSPEHLLPYPKTLLTLYHTVTPFDASGKEAF